MRHRYRGKSCVRESAMGQPNGRRTSLKRLVAIRRLAKSLRDLSSRFHSIASVYGNLPSDPPGLGCGAFQLTRGRSPTEELARLSQTALYLAYGKPLSDT